MKEEKKVPEISKEPVRQFADDESRRIYEESIKQAEVPVEEEVKSKKPILATNRKEDVEENEFAKEIRSMLQNTDSARKAVVLGEILTRKY